MLRTRALNNGEERPATQSRRLHASTYVVVALAALVLFFLNVPGQYVPHVGIPVVDDWTADDPRIVRERLEHGWPLAYLIRDDSYVWPGDVYQPTAVWSFTENLVAFRMRPLLADIVAALCLLGIMAIAAEYWRRQRTSVWQLRLSDLLGVTAIVALAMWYALDTSRDYERELAALHAEEDRVAPSHFDPVLHTRGGPTWLRTIIGEERFLHLFDRLICAYASDKDLAQLGAFKKLKGLSLYLDTSNPRAVDLSEHHNVEAIEFDFQSGRRDIWTSGAGPDSDVLDERLARFLPSLESLPKLWLIHASGDGVGDRSAKVFATLPRLRALKLSTCRLSDDGLRSLADCERLEELYFEDVDVTANGLQHFHKLHDLHTLSLSGCWLYGPVFEQLAKLSTLRRLDLRGAYVNSTRLHLLADLPALQTLTLPEGLENGAVFELKRRLPAVRIDLDGKEILASDDSTE